MSSKNRKPRTSPQPPLLGGLLRLARQELLNHLERELAEQGFGDMSAAQYAVSQQLAGAPDGKRLTDLATYAGITKASMSALVQGMERAGYVERVPEASDQRAHRIRFTDRGWKFARAAEKAVRRQETRWEERVGKKHVESLRRILRAIVETRPDA